MKPGLATLAALVSLAASATVHADAVGEAQALFDQGITDLKAQRYDQACKELGASLAKHPDSGTKGALAVCLTKLGKTASAWQLWRDLADTEPQPDLRADAAAKAAELEPRLPRYVVTLTGAAAPGLVVTVNGGEIDPSVHVPLPVDPGPIAVTARAPEHDDWAHSFDAVEGKTTAIEVPPLVAHPSAKPAAGGGYASDDSARHHRRMIAVGIGAAGGAAIVAGAIFGGVANSKFSTAKSDCSPMTIDMCPGPQFAQSQKDFNSANTAATTSDVLFIAGGAVLVGAAVTWLTAPSEERIAIPSHALRVVPTVDPRGGAGLALTGAW